MNDIMNFNCTYAEKKYQHRPMIYSYNIVQSIEYIFS